MAQVKNIWNKILETGHDSRTARITISLDQLNALISATTPLIDNEVIINHKLCILNWEHFEFYIKSKIKLTDTLHDFLPAYIIINLFQHVKNKKPRGTHISVFFDSPQNALAFIQYVQHIMPLKSSEYPKLNDKIVTISKEQDHLLNRTSMLRSENLSNEFFQDCYLKTLRADPFDFTSTFLITLFNTSEPSRALQNLRPKNRKAFLIQPDGNVISRHERKLERSPHKNGYTQIQSLTLMDDRLLSPAFGHSKREVLYGLITHEDDLIISRLLLDDSGTIRRPFESDDHPSSLDNHLQKKLENRGQFSEQQLVEFKKANVERRLHGSSTNEVLARIRFNPFRSFVSICSNNLASRLLAFDFAEELSEQFKLNPAFRIPIVFFNKPKSNESISFFERLDDDLKQYQLSLYTVQMRQDDIETCKSIISDPLKRNVHYLKHEFEFLLGLDELTLDIFLEEIDGIPLAYFMIVTGYARMLIRILRPERLSKLKHTDPKLLDTIFDHLLRRGFIPKNDITIAELIRIEEFTLADKLITATNSEKKELKFRSMNLVTYLIEKGNPRQLCWMGLNELLILAAQQKHWVTVRLCLKERKNLDKILLDTLLSEAIKQCQLSEALLPLKLGAGNGVMINQAIRQASEKKPIDKASIRQFLKLFPEHEKYPEFGRALIISLRQGELNLAIDIFNAGISQRWRNQDTGKIRLESALFYVIMFSMDDLLTLAYQHDTSFKDNNTETRLRLARDLAMARENKTAIAFFNDINLPNPLTSTEDPIRSVCVLVFEAYILRDSQLAEWRLFSYSHQFNIIPEDCDDTLYALKILLTSLDKALPFLPLNSSVKAHKLAARLFLIYKNSCLYLSIRELLDINLKGDLVLNEKEVAKTLLDRFCSSQLQNYKEIIAQSRHLLIWLEELSMILFRLVESIIIHNICNSHHEDQSKLDSFCELAIFIIDLVNQNDSVSAEDPVLYSEFRFLICTLFRSCYKIRHDKTLHTILYNSFIINNMNDDLLSVMIDFHEDKSDESYFNNLFKKHPFIVKSKHIEQAFSKNNKWGLLFLLKSLNDVDIQKPKKYWDYFKIWRFIIHSIIYHRPEEREALASSLGPIRCRHYTFTYLSILIYHYFKDKDIFYSYIRLKRFFDHEPVKKLIADLKIELSKDCEDQLQQLQPALKIFDNYFSNFTSFETLPDEQTLHTTYAALIALFERPSPRSSLTFHSPEKKTGLITALHTDLLETDRLLKKVDRRTQSQTDRDLSDIAYYL